MDSERVKYTHDVGGRPGNEKRTDCYNISSKRIFRMIRKGMLLVAGGGMLVSFAILTRDFQRDEVMARDVCLARTKNPNIRLTAQQAEVARDPRDDADDTDCSDFY